MTGRRRLRTRRLLYARPPRGRCLCLLVAHGLGRGLLDNSPTGLASPVNNSTLCHINQTLIFTAGSNISNYKHVFPKIEF